MTSEPTSWVFSGSHPTVPILAGPPPSHDSIFDRSAGYKVYASDSIGCMAAALATVLGTSPATVARLLGENPTVAEVREYVELWDPAYTMAYWPADEPWLASTGKVIALYRERTGAHRERDESGRWAAAAVHAFVVHGDDATPYHDPHITPLADPTTVARLGYLAVTLAAPTPGGLA